MNPNIYIAQKHLAEILSKCKMIGLLLYLEGEAIKKLNHEGKIKMKYTSPQNMLDNSFISSKNLYIKTSDRLVKHGFAEKKGDYYITKKKSKKDLTNVKFDVSMFYLIKHNSLKHQNQIEYMTDMIWLELFDLYFNKSRKKKEKLLGICANTQRTIERRNRDRCQISPHYHIIDLRTETEKESRRYGNSPVFRLNYNKKTKTTYPVNKDKKYYGNCFGRQTVNKTFIETLNAVSIVKSSRNEAPVGSVESTAGSSGKTTVVLDDDRESLHVLSPKDFKCFVYHDKHLNAQMRISNYDYVYDLSEKGNLKPINVINNHPLFSAVA